MSERRAGGGGLRAVWLAALAGLLATGVALLGTYVPSLDDAFDSVLFEHRRSGLGALLRSGHLVLSHVLVAALLADLGSRFAAGRTGSRAERRGWWRRAALLLLAVAAWVTGMLLPMDQNAYWGSTVRLAIVESVPGVGQAVADSLRGGAAIGVLTVPRFFALHVSLLPLAAVALLAFGRRSVRPWRGVRGRHLVVSVGLLAVAIGLCALREAPLEPRADPAAADYVPRPEWFVLWLFELGRLLPGAPWLRSVVVPLALVAGLALLPLLAPLRRSARLTLLAVLLLLLGGLSSSALWRLRELPSRPTWEEARAQRSGRYYADLCAECHGAEGRGDGPRSRSFGLGTPDFRAASASERGGWPAVIRDGRGKDMPAFGQRLREEEIEALVERLTQLAGERKVSGARWIDRRPCALLAAGGTQLLGRGWAGARSRRCADWGYLRATTAKISPAKEVPCD